MTEPRATAPALPREATYVAVSIRGDHPEHPGWSQPVQVYFRRAADGWKTVGLFRSAARGK